VWLLLGLFSLFEGLLAIPGRNDDVVLLALGLVLTAAGLVGPHALQKESYGLLGRAGFYIAVASLLARGINDPADRIGHRLQVFELDVVGAVRVRDVLGTWELRG
jgi:hypothetical protein